MVKLLRFVIDVKPGEVRALAWSWLYFFSILSAYYVIRPIRDEIRVRVEGLICAKTWLR